MTLDTRLILLAPEDNCLIAAASIEAGTALDIEGETIVLAKTIALGHKIARRALAANEKVIRYGAPIGHVSIAVAKGERLHTHNRESGSLPTYPRDEAHSYAAP